MEYSGAWGKLIHEKNQKQKISWHCPFKEPRNRFRSIDSARLGMVPELLKSFTNSGSDQDILNQNCKKLFTIVTISISLQENYRLLPANPETAYVSLVWVI